ncbi:hypothetical protein [Photorhabdus sp. CRCIA-P01]|uniref:hypothetical protein n=1 Tax=Photorhabdus sp. CRCIA-P01 TaxID=2019570 RepID=UPI0013008619|nr:hypothetical protein [Photorhabdus sp. CRCIA-P01]
MMLQRSRHDNDVLALEFRTELAGRYTITQAVKLRKLSLSGNVKRVRYGWFNQR